MLNWGHKVYCVIVPHGGAFVNHIGFSRTEIYTEIALKPHANFPQKARLWVAFVGLSNILDSKLEGRKPAEGSHWKVV